MKKSTMKITKEMKIDEVIQKYPETMEVFSEFGFHCFGCAVAAFENLEQGAAVHKIDVDKLIEKLNNVIHEK